MKKRVTIFAHYDKDDVIDDYVIRYLKALKKLSNIIFVSDSDLPEVQLAKIKDIVMESCAKKHGEYDFGSYKRGCEIFYKQGLHHDVDELIFVNDSCYVTACLENVFREMEARQAVDFWGMVENTNEFPVHIQSYFMVFHKAVMHHPSFIQFMKDVVKQDSKKEVIVHYEVGLTQLLMNVGFRKDSYMGTVFANNPVMSDMYFDALAVKGFPLLKVGMLRSNPCRVRNVLEKVKKLGFSHVCYQEIDSHIKRVVDDRSHLVCREDFIFLHRKLFSLRYKLQVVRIHFLGIRIYKNVSGKGIVALMHCDAQSRFRF